MHARMPKNFVLEERLERYADAIEVNAPAYRGSWAEACWPIGETGEAQPCSRAPRADRFASVRLDLGCGKGSYLVRMARREPDTLFIGMDSEPVCVAYAAQALVEAGVPNALVIPGDASRLDALFAADELDAITINFPTPHPKRRDARRRIVNAAHLAAYRPLLREGGTVTLRTDSQPLFDYALPQFEAAGYHALWTSRDTRTEHPEIPSTEYEERLSSQGARVNGICAVPEQPEPTAAQLAAARELPQSLYDYLPDNLFEGAYIPHGMSYAIENFRNHRARSAARERSNGPVS